MSSVTTLTLQLWELSPLLQGILLLPLHPLVALPKAMSLLPLMPALRSVPGGPPRLAEGHACPALRHFQCFLLLQRGDDFFLFLGWVQRGSSRHMLFTAPVTISVSPFPVLIPFSSTFQSPTLCSLLMAHLEAF